jgi:WD40 repeat protein
VYSVFVLITRDLCRVLKASKACCSTGVLALKINLLLLDRTVRTYKFPSLEREHILGGHRAAVNAVSLTADSGLIVSGSGDRSIRLWDGKTGALVRVLENHHIRG